MAKKTGRVTVKLDNVTLRSKPGASMDMGGVKREYGVTDQGVTYFSEEYVNSMIECTLVHMADTDLIALRDTTDATITFECDTGPVYTMPGGGLVEPPKLQNGECPVKFVGGAMK